MQEILDILLLLKAGDVDLGRHAWHSCMWSARLTEVLEARQATSQTRPTLHVRSFKSGLKPRDLQVLCGGKGFSALGGFKVAQNDGTYTGSCGFLAQHPVNWDGFKLCTLQSGDKTPSTPPWRGSLSTATKHRQYQCFQLLQFARVASNHAMDRVFCGCPAKNLVKTDGV